MSTAQLPSRAAVRELAASLEQKRCNVLGHHESDPVNWRAIDARRQANHQQLQGFTNGLSKLNRQLAMLLDGEAPLVRASAEAIRDLAAWQSAHDAWLQSEPQPPVADGQLPADLSTRAQAAFTSEHAEWVDEAGGLMSYWREVRLFLDRVQTVL